MLVTPWWLLWWWMTETQCCIAPSHANFFWFCLLFHTGRNDWQVSFYFLNWKVASKLWHGKAIILASCADNPGLLSWDVHTHWEAGLPNLPMSWCTQKHLHGILGWMDEMFIIGRNLVWGLRYPPVWVLWRSRESVFWHGVPVRNSAMHLLGHLGTTRAISPFRGSQ